MTDLETLGSNPKSPILSLNATRFNPVTGKTFESLNVTLDLHEQLEKGFMPDAGTLMWWLDQGDVARKALTATQKNPVSLAMFEQLWSNFIALMPFDKNDLYHWGKSPTFDQIILAHALKHGGLTSPWKYSNTRDVRTIEELAPEIANAVKFIGTPHVPEDDSLHQIRRICAVFRYLLKV